MAFPIRYEIDPKTFTVYSVVGTTWGGPARNFVKECKSLDEAEETVERLKRMKL
ncbi:hypothetical protein AU106_gp107 [Sinorhizobium phage phiM9]|uniref:WGR domain-containing protein n=1 Tax=Sinorhizobium phage phiM9 TaxID=1636182 RepID=A0A0F6R7J2_9CAUD|nr:hypothetical protein AU106_gp107 [Sinorhizobium phage phiM9]AKE44738.1 hypothetical protein Sm_phiM9_110 [Sinorhizobium phage phiM9]